MDFTVQPIIRALNSSLKLGNNPTGGWLYHWRAFRYKADWAPFCQAVERWLNDWIPAGNPIQTLVLIGPSAGYTLPPEFIYRFQHIIAVEPDVSAQIIFQARFRRPVQWLGRDFFGLDLKNPNPKILLELFELYPSAAFLFCNVLGQIPVILREQRHGSKGARSSDIEAYMKNLGEVLARLRTGYKIASYHDRFSRDLKRPNEVIDHLTGDLFANWPVKREFPWRLTKRFEHQIEFVTNE